ncbi:Motile sperm domain-containing protein 2 [Halotydeus destructor]|nr:Motile sperm domain-containing protein 2 [Halotydeus destructor]
MTHIMADSTQVSILRQRFLEEYEQNKTLYCDKDVDLVRNSDFYVGRFINFLNQGVDKGFEHLKEAFKIRKKFDISNCVPTEFADYTQDIPAFSYLPDKEGVSIIHLRSKLCSKLRKENNERFEKFILQLVYAVDLKANKEFGFAIVMDCSDIGVSDVDISFIMSILPKLRKCFPNGTKYCIIYGLHWSVNYVCKMAVAAMPADSAKKIRFLGKQGELFNLIDPANLPDYLNGTCSKEWRKFPSILALNTQ